MPWERNCYSNVYQRGKPYPLQKRYRNCNCESEISNVGNAVEGHCLQAMKIVHHYANGCFDWLIPEQQSVNPSREAISILSGKYKRFTLVHPVMFDIFEPTVTAQ